ncbi:MAG: TIGR01777 family oxidoreductase [Flavobacteriaceae bacterium]
MKVLITGATGLIGNEIVALCHERNMTVNYLTTHRNKVISRSDCQGFYWNPNTLNIDLGCFKEVSAIINLAGASISKRWTNTYKKEILESRLNALRTLNKALNSVDTSGIQSFVSASAIGVYPHSFISFYTEEEKEVDDSFIGDVVKAWEEELHTFTKFNFNISILRIGLVMSSKGGALVEMTRPVKNYVGAAFGAGTQWQSWIHINDLARIFLFLVENRMQGVYNGVASNPVTNTKLIKEIAKALNRPLVLPNISKFILKILLGEMSYLLFVSQRVGSKKIEDEGFIFEYRNISKALEEIYHKDSGERPEDANVPRPI